jgi:hypothetical protein
MTKKIGICVYIIITLLILLYEVSVKNKPFEYVVIYMETMIIVLLGLITINS